MAPSIQFEQWVLFMNSRNFSLWIKKNENPSCNRHKYHYYQAHKLDVGGRSSGVEHNLAKVGVEGSNPFARSRLSFHS